MTETTPPRILVALDVNRRREGGDLLLRWNSSRKIIQYVDVGAGEMAPIEMVEPVDISETISFETDAELDEAIERYRLAREALGGA